MPLYKEQITKQLAPLVALGLGDLRIYFVGSLATSTSYNSRLSDVDLLFVPTCNKLSDYVSHFEQAIRINAELSHSRDWLIETFMMSSRLAPVYFKVLPVIAGGRTLETKDIAFGSKDPIASRVPWPSDAARRELYIAKALRFQQEYIDQLPVSDTSKARKVAKNALRGLKLMICAKTDSAKLASVEGKLISATTFEEVEGMFHDVFGMQLSLDKIFQTVLEGNDIHDWSAWMIAQDSFARKLLQSKLSENVTENERRFYDGFAQTRDMLNRGVKDILGEKDDDSRMERIGKYADDTASVIVKLGLAGVTNLTDFEMSSTPLLVTESFKCMVAHLQGDTNGLQTLAASVALLEYAFEECFKNPISLLEK